MMRLTAGDDVGFANFDISPIILHMNDADSKPASPPSDDKAWEELVKNMLRAEMMRRGISYAVLAERLAEFGVTDNELNLRNKVSRGRFTAVFLAQCFMAMGVEWIQMPASLEEASGKGGAQAMAKKTSRPLLIDGKSNIL